MRLKDIIEKLHPKPRVGVGDPDAEVGNGYVSDLLSDVLANCEESDLWITLQIHPNIVGVASMKGLAAIVIINGREPQEDTVKRAEENGVPILVSDMTAFELSGRLYNLGLRGRRRDSEGV